MSMSERRPMVYILASAKNGTLYVGVTSRLVQRVAEHKSGLIKGFTGKYKVTRLVYYEEHGTMQKAISREKQVKKWNRAWKVRLIEESNPGWNDLAADWDDYFNG